MSEARRIYLAVPGEVEPEANPGLTPEARAEAISMAAHLPSRPPMIVCGTGLRHLDLAGALGLDPTYWTTIVGTPEKLWCLAGGASMVTLADGTPIARKRYHGTIDRQYEFLKLLHDLPHDSVVITSRGSTVGILGLDHPQSTTIICLRLDDSGIINHQVIVPEPKPSQAEANQPC